VLTRVLLPETRHEPGEARALGLLQGVQRARREAPAGGRVVPGAALGGQRTVRVPRRRVGLVAAPAVTRLRVVLAGVGRLQRVLRLGLALGHQVDLLLLVPDRRVDGELGLLLAVPGRRQLGEHRLFPDRHRFERLGPVQEATRLARRQQRAHRAEPAGPVRLLDDHVERRLPRTELGVELLEPGVQLGLPLGRFRQRLLGLKEAARSRFELLDQRLGAALAVVAGVTRRRGGRRGDRHDQTGGGRHDQREKRRRPAADSLVPHTRSFRRPPTELADGFGTEAIPTTGAIRRRADSPRKKLVPRLAWAGD
jgi:hypothetical protein